MKKPICLVTGACGFMGTHMVEVLTQAGYRVRATDLATAHEKDDHKRGRFPSVLSQLGAEFVAADLTDPDSLRAVVDGVGYVFHLGAIFSYSAPWSALERVNVGGTKNLLDALATQECFQKIVYWGAGGIYDINETRLPITEESPVGPANDYLKSKLLAEQALKEFCDDHDMAWSIVRGTTVYGPRGVYGSGQMLMQAATAPVLAAPKNWTFRLPFVHAKDVCRAALHVAQRPECDGQDYIVNDDSELTMVDFLSFMADLTGHLFVPLPPLSADNLRAVLLPVAGLVQSLATKLSLPSPIERDTIEYLGVDFVFSNEKLKATGFEFEFPDTRVGVADTVAWYQNNGWI